MGLTLLLALGLRFIPYTPSAFAGYDPFTHYTVVEQALENKALPITNSLDGCPQGIMVNHPIGFYLPPFFLGKLINLKLAFALSSVLFGVASILLVYLLLRKVFGKRTALVGALFLAVSFGHISRSNAIYYRGENFIVPFLLLSLVFGVKWLTEDKKILFASLAAVSSAATVLFWPGYPYAILVYLFSVALFITYDFLKGNPIRENSKYAFFSFILQFALVKIISKLLTVPEHVFSASFYLPFVLLPAILFLVALNVFAKYGKQGKPRLYFIGALLILVLIIALVKRDIVALLSTGFGLLKPTTAFYKNIIELTPITVEDWFRSFWIVPVFSLAGLLVMLFKHDNKKAFLLGAILPSIYLLTTTKRFIFLGALLFIPLIGVAYIAARRWKKKLMFGILATLFILTTAHGIFGAADIDIAANPDMVVALTYFRENTKPGSCLITIPDWGGMTQYYAKRASYISSTNQDIPKFNKLNAFLFSNQSLPFSIEESYIGLMPDDFKKISGLIQLSENKDLFAEQLLLVKKEREGGLEKNSYVSVNKHPYLVISSGRNITARKLQKGKPVAIANIFIESDGKVHTRVNEAEDKGCLYLSDYVTAYFNEELCATNIIKILTQQSVPGLQHWYSHNNVRIYKVET